MNHNILIVDDEPDILSILVNLLSREPYGVFSACSAKEALGILAHEQIDVVISDERMPGMSGSEFLAIVRKKFPNTIRIILTGHASLEAAIRAINKGKIYRFFTKPCNVIDIAITVRQALRHKALMKKTQRLLSVNNQQSEIMDEMEMKYPGITKVRRTKGGAIIIDDEKRGQAEDIDEEYDAIIKLVCKTLEK